MTASTPQSALLSSIGNLGSIFVTGGQTVVNPNGWVGFRSIDNAVVLAGITGNNMSGVSYLVGRSLTHPVEILGGITNLALTTGSAAIQLFY